MACQAESNDWKGLMARPKASRDLVAELEKELKRVDKSGRQKSARIAERLVSIAMDSEDDGRAIQAASTIMDRLYGQPQQHLTQDVTTMDATQVFVAALRAHSERLSNKVARIGENMATPLLIDGQCRIDEQDQCVTVTGSSA